MKHVQQFWSDEGGFIISAELVIIATVVVLGLITGLKCVQNAINGELKDVAAAFGSLNQSYYYSGFSKKSLYGCNVKAYTRGSVFVDQQDEIVYAAPCEMGETIVAPQRVIERTQEDLAPCEPGTIIEGQEVPCPGAVESTIEMPIIPAPCPEAAVPGASPCPPAASGTTGECCNPAQP